MKKRNKESRAEEEGETRKVFRPGRRADGHTGQHFFVLPAPWGFRAAFPLG